MSTPENVETPDGTPFVPCQMETGCRIKYTCRTANICLDSLTLRKRTTPENVDTPTTKETE